MLFLFVCILLLSNCTDTPAPTFNSNLGTLALHLCTPERAKGKVHVAIFNSAHSFKRSTNPVYNRVVEVDPASGQYKVISQSLKIGEYAIAAYQDVNGNGELDKNAVGIPTEPYAFSNNPVIKWAAPTYEKVHFELMPGEAKMELNLKYWADY